MPLIHRILQLYKQSFGDLSRPVWLLAVVTMINRAGTMVIPFLTVYLSNVLGFSLSQTGWIMMFFGVGSVVGTFLGGILTDRAGYYPVQFWSLMLSGGVLLSLQFVEGFYAWCGVIFLFSTIADAFRPANMASVAVYSKPKNRTRSISLIRMAINTGWAIGPAIGGLLAGGFGYHLLFWVDGLTCMVAALFFFVALPQRKLKAHIAEEEPGKVFHTSVYNDRHFLWFVLFTMLGSITFFQLFNTLPVFFKEIMEMDEATIGQLIAVNGLLIALFEMPVVFLVESRYRLLAVIVVGTVLVGLSFLVLNISNWIGIAILSTFIITIGEILSMPFANAFSLQRANPKSRGKYMALFGMAYSVAIILAPVVGMNIAEAFGFSILWVVMFAISIAAAAGLWWLGKGEERRTSPY